MTEKKIALIPGFMLDDTLWDSLVTWLPEDWRIQRITLPHGRTVHEVAQGVADQLDGPTIVLGFSMGGYIARALTAVAPSAVDALVLVATSSRLEGAAGTRKRSDDTQVNFRGLSRRAIQRSLGPENSENEALIEHVHAMSLRLGGDTFKWQSELDRSDVPLQQITCPTLVIAAENDQLRTVQESRDIVDSVAGADFRVVSGVGHLIPLEAPRQLAALVQDWIEDSAAPG